jgi:hypothetical protein
VRRPDLSKWNSPNELEGLLTFAQCLDELLFDHSLDTFKAPALNLHLSVLEVVSLLRGLSEGRYEPAVLKFAMEELEFHLNFDPVLPRPTPPPWVDYFEKMKNPQADPGKRLIPADALLIEVSTLYWPWLKSMLVSAVGEPKRKARIIELAKAFATEVELRGFSRRYAYFENWSYFFDPQRSPEQIETPEQLNGFLSRFEREPRDRTVIFRGSKDFQAFSGFSTPFHLAISEVAPNIASPGSRTRMFLGTSNDFPLYIIAQPVSGRDEYSARDTAQELLETFTDVCRFSRHTSELHISNPCLVVEPERDFAYVIPPPKNPMLCHHGGSEGDCFDSIKKSIEILSGYHFSRSLRNDFIRVLDYHEAALCARTRENQLLNLWSSLEGFLPVPDGKTSRIEYYQASLVPALTITYSEKIVDYLCSALMHVNDAVRSLIDSIPVTGQQVDKVAALMSCAEFEEERQQLLELLSIDPFLRYRCFWCHSNFCDNESIRKLLKRHQQRVSWHIQRIYTMRNQIAHSASALPYLPSLVENLHSYLDTLVKVIVEIGVASESRAQIGGVLALIGAHSRALMARLSGKKTDCTLSSYRDLILTSRQLLRP